MLDLRAVCTKKKQRPMIQFIWSEGVSGADIHCNLSVQCRDSTLPRRSVCELIKKFKNSQTSEKHEEGAGDI